VNLLPRYIEYSQEIKAAGGRFLTLKTPDLRFRRYVRATARLVEGLSREVFGFGLTAGDIRKTGFIFGTEGKLIVVGGAEAQYPMGTVDNAPIGFAEFPRFVDVPAKGFLTLSAASAGNLGKIDGTVGFIEFSEDLVKELLGRNITFNPNDGNIGFREGKTAATKPLERRVLVG